MIKEIECPGENLEDFILYADQISYYRFILGEPNRSIDKKTIDFFYKGKAYAKQFEDEKEEGREFMISLEAHIGLCNECSRKKEELREKYRSIKPEELKKLTEKEKINLKYFDLLE